MSSAPSSIKSGSEYPYRKLFSRLQTTSVFPSDVTAMPCDGSDPAGTVFLPGGRSGFLIRFDFLARREVHDREAVETVNCTKIHFVEPSAFVENVMGRTPRSMSSVQAGCSVCASKTFDGLARDGARDDVLAVRRDVRIVDAALRRQRLDVLERRGVDDVDATGRLDDPDVHAASVAADGDVVRVPAQRDPVRHLERLRVDDVERALGFIADVDAAAVGSRTAAPWFTSIPVITPTTVFVTGSMTCTLSPALLVWMIRTFRSAGLTDTVQRSTTATTVRDR